MELGVLARKYSLDSMTALGLGAGLYFEYFRTPHQLPTHFISGLNREIGKTLDLRILIFRQDPGNALSAALRENALWFNLDRAPTNGLLGMEMLAEELPQFETLADRSECLLQMAETVRVTRGLHRQTYADFLYECSTLDPAATNLGRALNEIAHEWLGFAEQLAQSASDPSRLERAGRLLRRIAIREEHFWGSVLEM